MTTLPREILEHYEDPYHRGECERATHGAEVENAACGDTIVVQLRVANDRIEQAWFDGEGCQLSQAVASMLMEQVEGKSLDEIDTLSPDQLLSGLEIELSAAQRLCCQVAFDAVHAAFNSVDDEFGDGPSFTGPDLGDEC